MSSHHIVRDEQEPALLIDDPKTLGLEFVELLLEWSPTVVVTTNALEEVLHWGIKIDVVIAQFEQVEALKPRLKPQSPVKLLAFESNDLLNAGFVYLLDNQYPAVNVLADIFSTRILDMVKELSTELDVVLFYNNQKWVYVRRGLFQKWVSTGQVFGIHPIVPGTFFKSEGFYTEMENEPYLEPFELRAEVTGKVRVQSNEKPFWLIEEVQTDVYK
ncbi:hypothetical protein [Roseivirga pacifica]|uniref:hypothetical protein n=1 Tax=Roseivirga pacifica TaxID=1267423 RepID=UPI002094622C|nr:hypothetical protein [Roseivirga pacifica]MCO6359773.1 hypothetical protein [Roseivirga pacifica]MCO6367143.1 hypothetical protein [Roseivirga pacifica]MCO6370325.1 hypothetical protein [Roseivirga pacifica]MCO6374800.1 hypothetical protein [Roseivirga pacifica]MCO6380058.1 hypothetical protein [Roseivirga pacifica]